MPTPVIMPKYEMSQETGKIACWLKREGDAVEKGEPLLEIETDKTNIEVEARASGILAGICVEPGQVVPVGQPIAYILKPGETLATAAVPPAAQPTAATPAAAAPGSSALVRATPVAERIAAEHGIDLRAVTATGSGGRITREDVATHLAAQAAQAAQAAPQPPADGKVKAVPAARRLARELGVDLRTVAGTGPEGRVQPEDVETAAARPMPAAEPPSAISYQPSVIGDQPSAIGHQPSAIGSPPSLAIRRVVPLTNIRRTIAERMTASVREAPQFDVSVDVDMGRSQAIVEDLKAGTVVDPARPKITLTALLVKACAWALSQFPVANSMFETDQLVEWAEINIGVATAIEQGLIVPVVHNADRLGMKDIAARLTDLTARARENRLKLEDLQGGTFTISNLGMLGIDRFTAILNPPQAAILAVGRVAKRAEVGADDRIEVRPMASLTLTADHRVLDGATAARFLATLKLALEHPGLLMQ